MKILIAAGITPPKTSGPAQYAENMSIIWSEMGHKVSLKTFYIENFLPTGIRHFYYFCKILPSVVSSDIVFALDTFSVGFPAVLASKIFGKKCVIRTGGDFLWEGYVERTGDLVLLREFYKKSINNFSVKERTIFRITKWTLNNVNKLVFSTDWQRQIFLSPYGLNPDKTLVIENHFDKSKFMTDKGDSIPQVKNFIASTRLLKWKNIPYLKGVFDESITSKGAVLDLEDGTYDQFMKKIDMSYAVILVSLGDISPHMISDAIGLNKPFIVTEENGIMNRISPVAITVNPKDKKDIQEKILWLLDEKNYRNQVEKIKNFSFNRSWKDIAEDYMSLFKIL